MGIIFDGDFFNELDQGRLLVVGGRLSSGKTLLTQMIVERYLKRKYRYLTNIASVWADPLEYLEERRPEKCVVNIDEGGIYIRTQETVNMLATFAAKMDNYIIISGKKEPHAELCFLRIRMWLDCRTNFFIPLYIWRWDATDADPPYHGLLFEGPRFGYYGIFDSIDPGDYPERTIKVVEKWAQEFFEEYHRTYHLSDVAKSGGVDGANGQSTLEDTQAAIRELALSLQGQKGGRRR